MHPSKFHVLQYQKVKSATEKHRRKKFHFISRSRMFVKSVKQIRVRHSRKNYGNEIELKGVKFPGRGAPDKINRGS